MTGLDWLVVDDVEDIIIGLDCVTPEDVELLG